MIETVRNAWKIPDLRKKLLYVIFALIVFRFGYAIYVPYVDTAALGAQFMASNSGNLLGYFNILAGGGLQQASIFALSIYPYINSSIIIQLLQVAIPALERLAKEGGEEGKKKINFITRCLTLLLAAVMGFSYQLLLKSYGVMTRTDLWSIIVVIMTFIAGSMFVMWLGERITQKGIGNGISMILLVGIVSRGPTAVQTIINGFKTGSMNVLKLLIILVTFVAIIAFIIYITNAERRIPVQYAKRVVGRKQYGGQSTHLPMKVNMSGVMPVIFASTIVSVPATIVAFTQPAEGTFLYKFANNWFAQNAPAYIIIYVLLIFAFAYFYSAIQFNPIEVANNLRKNGGFIPGFRPGRPTSDFITKVLNKVTLMGAIFLAIIAGLPLIMSNIPGLATLGVGGTSVMIMVGVILETTKAIENEMLMRHYKGFLE
ncbi:MAG: preprotein translocase subunit SecY [Clostridia bacterium]|nr:preprotein translocase subunit SecY [Clostridia bacterium]